MNRIFSTMFFAALIAACNACGGEDGSSDIPAEGCPKMEVAETTSECRQVSYMQNGFNWCQASSPEGFTFESPPVSNTVSLTRTPQDWVILQSYVFTYYLEGQQPWASQPGGYLWVDRIPIQASVSKQFVPELELRVVVAGVSPRTAGTVTLNENSCGSTGDWSRGDSIFVWGNTSPAYVYLVCANCGQLQDGDTMDLLFGEGTVDGAQAFGYPAERGGSYSLVSRGHVTRITFQR